LAGWLGSLARFFMSIVTGLLRLVFKLLSDCTFGLDWETGGQ